MTDLSTRAPLVYKPVAKVRFVTAASLFDGHDASINIMRRILQATGCEVIHLGHNRSVEEIVDCAIQEDAHGIAVSSYQGGHVEFFTYMLDLLRERGAANVKVFGGGGGVIVGAEIETLHAYGYASSPLSRTAEDSLTLADCRITNSVKCLPPENKPTPAEVRMCNDYLAADVAMVPPGGAVLALGRIAHDATLVALRARRSDHTFAHGARHQLRDGVALFDSYHCSRYNTNTGRLTPAMFRAVCAVASLNSRVRCSTSVAIRSVCSRAVRRTCSVQRCH